MLVSGVPHSPSHLSGGRVDETGAPVSQCTKKLPSKQKIHFFDSILTHSQTPTFTHYTAITRRDNKWRPLPVYESRPRSQRRANGREWKTTHPGLGPTTHNAGLFSRSTRCRNGFNTTTTSGFLTVTGPYRARLAPRSAVGAISTTRRSTSIPISYRPSSSSLASGTSCSTLPASIPELLAPILWPFHSSYLRRLFAMHFRLFITL